MDSLFLLKLLLSFFVGGIWVILSTVFADRYGSKIGGLITGLPSTILFSFLFLAWSQGPQFTVAATTISPAAVGAENFFGLTYIYLVSKNFWLALGTAFLIFFLLAFGLYSWRLDNYVLSLLIYVLSMCMFIYLVESILKIKSVHGEKIALTPKIILLRGLISGTIIAGIVLLGRLGGPILGGIFSGFPAVYTSTMLITYFSRGASFSAATMKVSTISFISGVIYSIGVRYTYLPLGIIWGTFASAVVKYPLS